MKVISFNIQRDSEEIEPDKNEWRRFEPSEFFTGEFTIEHCSLEDLNALYLLFKKSENL